MLENILKHLCTKVLIDKLYKPIEIETMLLRNLRGDKCDLFCATMSLCVFFGIDRYFCAFY